MMLRPIAQGTFRPLSERPFYWLLYHLAGLDAAPARVFCFVLQAANCGLLALFTKRLTGSIPIAAFAASAWAVHPSLALPMTWVAATNQLMWAFCVLVCLYCFVRYCDHGGKWMLAGAWVSYLLGFGVLESNIAVAGLVVLYALFRNRSCLFQALLFAIPAVTFSAAHLLFIPKSNGGAYTIHLGTGILHASWRYWEWLWRMRPQDFGLGGSPWESASVGVVMLAVCAALIAAPRSRRLSLFGLGWIVVSLSPFLPFQAHVTEYYLAVPAIGIAILFAAGWSSYPVPTSAVFAVYLALNVPLAYKYAAANAARGKDMEALMLGVGEAQKLHPGSTLLLKDVNDALLWSGIYDTPFSLVGAPATKLTPESAKTLTPYPGLFRADDYTLPPAEIAKLHSAARLEIYRVSSRKLIKATTDTAPPQIQLGSRKFDSYLGPQWYAAEDGFRWMPSRATAEMEGRGETLIIRGFCLVEQLSARPHLEISAKWNDTSLGTSRIATCPQQFTLTFPLPQNRSTRGTVTIEVAPLTRIPSDQRDLGLAVSLLEIR
ncbi:MAG: hypothetical protein HYX27_15480 [Acidobacteria bacterium]|nr:hypothetical protein [Acidobacteriota bacterium]